MDVTQIPFVKHLGIEKNEEGILKLEPTLTVQNHIQTIHAAAQFTLAETQSGLYLQTLFPEYRGKVMPLLRESSVKYKKPATSTLTASAYVEEGVKEKFLIALKSKRRAIITVDVELRDENQVVTMRGDFTWFIGNIE